MVRLRWGLSRRCDQPARVGVCSGARTSRSIIAASMSVVLEIRPVAVRLIGGGLARRHRSGRSNGGLVLLGRNTRSSSRGDENTVGALHNHIHREPPGADRLVALLAAASWVKLHPLVLGFVLASLGCRSVVAALMSGIIAAALTVAGIAAGSQKGLRSCPWHSVRGRMYSVGGCGEGHLVPLLRLSPIHVTSCRQSCRR